MTQNGDLKELQELLDRSATQAGEHLRRTFEMPEHSLSAARLVRYLARTRSFALATVTPQGEPRVAPVHAVFLRNAFHVPTAADAVRIKHVLRQPAVSATHFVLNSIAIIVHGRGSIISGEHPDFAELEHTYQAAWWTSLREHREGVYLRITPERLYAWALDRTEFTE